MVINRIVIAVAILAGIGTSACTGTRSSDTAAAQSRDGATLQGKSAPLALSDAAAPAVQPTARETTFSRLVRQLSESGGFFDSDNIISNETSYLHVIDGLRRLRVRGGVYVGVGPDQNFSYILAVRPAIAFMLDIRRDNMFEHLLFKAIFALADNRVEYLCRLFEADPAQRRGGRGAPHRSRPCLSRHHGNRFRFRPRDEARDRRQIASFGVALSAQDLEVIDRYRAQFVAEGLDVRFSSFNRNNRTGYRTFGGSYWSATDPSDSRTISSPRNRTSTSSRSRQRTLSFPWSAMSRVTRRSSRSAGYARARGEAISVFYISNVEQYLMRDGLFPQFAENVKRLPRDSKSVFIRSYFGRFGMNPPLSMPGHLSTSILATMDSFVKEYEAGNIRSYIDLIDHGYVGP